MSDPSGFANPWEHVRLLSDGRRNAALIDMLARRAPGARVLEVGCGTGLLACAAAKLGATHVIAMEPTPLAGVAERMVEANGLGDRVRVVRSLIEDAEPEPMDLVFSELLNADPFVEGVLGAMDAAAAWRAPGGLLVPRRLKVWAAAARAGALPAEQRAARAEVRAIGARCGLDTRTIEAALATHLPYGAISGSERPIGPPVLVWDLPIGEGAWPEPTRVELATDDPGPVGGVTLWFEAELDDEGVLTNAPGVEGHWGRFVLAFSEEQGVARGGRVAVDLWVDEERVGGRWA